MQNLDEEWLRLLPTVKKLPGIYVGAPDRCRQLISAALWILRSGSQWRVLPSTRGKWNSVFKRFSRWCAVGAWEKLVGHFSEKADLQDVSINGSVIRARMRELMERHIVTLTMKQLDIPKVGLAARFTLSVMAWV